MAERDAISRMQNRLRLGGPPMDDEHQPCRLSGIRHLAVTCSAITTPGAASISG